MAETDTQRDQTPNPRLDIDWIKTAAGALAAVTAAVILSTLGAAGTLIGAAIGSVAATVGSALYTQGLAKSKQTVLKAQETALLNLGVSTSAVQRAHDAVADQDDDVAPPRPDDDGSTPRGSGLPWQRIGVLAGGTFVVAMLAITGFELVAGHSVSSYTGGSSSQGSTLGDVAGGTGTRPHHDGGTPSPSATPSGTASPSPSASTSPSASATTTPTATPTETPSVTPSVTPSTTPSATPTETPTETPTPTSSASGSASPSGTATP